MRATFQNSGMVLSVGVFFSLMIVGLSASLPHSMAIALQANGVSAAKAHQISSLPTVGSLFAAFLGYNPMQKLLGSAARRGRDPRPVRAHHRQVVLPAPHRQPVPHRVADRVRGVARDVPRRRRRIVDARRQVRARRRRTPTSRCAPKTSAPRCSRPTRCSRERRSSSLFRIGEAARRAGVTTRTLRYYQEVGLLQPSGATPGGNRLYTDADVERLRRILELRDVMGFDLERIRLFLRSEDRLAELRAEAAARPVRRRAGPRWSPRRSSSTGACRSEIAAKQGVLTGVLAELRAKAIRYREIAGEIGLDLDEARVS